MCGTLILTTSKILCSSSSCKIFELNVLNIVKELLKWYQVNWKSLSLSFNTKKKSGRTVEFVVLDDLKWVFFFYLLGTVDGTSGAGPILFHFIFCVSFSLFGGYFFFLPEKRKIVGLGIFWAGNSFCHVKLVWLVICFVS